MDNCGQFYVNGMCVDAVTDRLLLRRAKSYNVGNASPSAAPDIPFLGSFWGR